MIPNGGQRARSAAPLNRQMVAQRRPAPSSAGPPGPPDPYPPSLRQQQYGPPPSSRQQQYGVPPPSSQPAYRPAPQQPLPTQYEESDSFVESQHPETQDYRPTPAQYYPSPSTPAQVTPLRRARQSEAFETASPQQRLRRPSEYADNGTPRSTPSIARRGSVAPYEQGGKGTGAQLLELFNSKSHGWLR